MTKRPGQIVDLRELQTGDIFRLHDGRGGECMNSAPGGKGRWWIEWWDDDADEMLGHDAKQGEHVAVRIVQPRNEAYERELKELINGPIQHSSALDRLWEKHFGPTTEAHAS